MASTSTNIDPGLDIGYVPAGPDAFFRWFGPQQLIFYWPAGSVDYSIFFFFFFFFLPLIFEKCYEGGS